MTHWKDWRGDLFDPRKVPFSRRDTFFAISWLEEGAGGAFWLRNLRGGDEETDLGRMLKLEVLDQHGVSVEAVWRLEPDCLSARTEKGVLEFSFDGPDRICVSGDGLGLRMTSGASKYNYAQAGSDRVHICVARQDMRCDVVATRATLALSAPWNGLSSENIALEVLPFHGAAEAHFDLYRIKPHLRPTVSQARAQASSAAEFTAFLNQTAPVPAEFAPGRLLAAYILWSGYVPAEGALGSPAIYMSKNWMTNVWSWDHCFVALAFAETDPRAAFEQMQVIFDAQHASGRLPDYVNDRFSYWAFTKPPVHGWTFAQLRSKAPDAYDAARMKQILGWLETQASDWLAGPNFRGLPGYRHGNDGGWDNSTIFAEGGPVVGPDLVTFLILQFDEIAALHAALGNETAADAARSKADDLASALLQELWDGSGFVARMQTDGRIVGSGHSLLLFLPLLLGDRLPKAYRQVMVKAMRATGHYLTAHGLATERTDSPFYRADGYWRGPIWAPTTALFVHALGVSGEAALAAEVAARFCALCCKSGMAENFDALSGAGLCDPAFAWTSAVFLSLGNRISRSVSVV